MSADPITDTRSPWYECFTPSESPELRADTQPPVTALQTAEAAEPDAAAAWCQDALFDYYNG